MKLGSFIFGMAIAMHPIAYREPRVWWRVSPRRSRSRRSPMSSLLLAQSSGVEVLWSSLGNGRRTQQRLPRTASQESTESDRRDETPAALSTRVPRTEAALHTAFTQELLATSQRGVRHNVAHSPKDVYYIQ